MEKFIDPVHISIKFFFVHASRRIINGSPLSHVCCPTMSQDDVMTSYDVTIGRHDVTAGCHDVTVHTSTLWWPLPFIG